MNLENIYIGSLINRRVAECGIEMPRICKFLKCSEEEVRKMYETKSMDSDILLRWSKLLEYDFFRLYSQHLILYAPLPGRDIQNSENKKVKGSRLPVFKKNIYTRELIDFVLERIRNGEMTKLQAIEEYKIPKTTLYKWISKYEMSYNN